MRLKGLKRTIAAIMALVIVGGAMPSVSGGFLSVKPITASADYETENFSYDSKTGQLTLRGEISYSDYVKATPHKDCAEDAPTDFSSDCIEILQAYCRMSKNFCAR